MSDTAETLLTCACLCCGPCLAEEMGRTLRKDRMVAVALGVILGIGTIVGIILCCVTHSSHLNHFGHWQQISNQRYLPLVILLGGGASLFCFMVAANNPNKGGTSGGPPPYSQYG